MIIGIGIDHCSITRMEKLLSRFGSRFYKHFSAQEIAYCTKSAHRTAARFAIHFAAKEASAKALGTGFAQNVTLSSIEVLHLPSGQPAIQLHDGALDYLHKLLPKGTKFNIALSLTDEGDLASAFCIIESVVD